MEPTITSIPSDDAATIPLDADLLCGHCGQNLRGVASSQCPECGHRFDRGRLISDIIPWERRRSIGRFRAYWRTARLVTFRPGILWEQREGITLAAARSFRRWTLALLLILLLGAAFTWQQQLKASSSDGSYAFRQLIEEHSLRSPEEFAGNTWFFTVSCVCILPALLAITGIAGYFFHPKRFSSIERKRSVALCHYACAPLAWLVALSALFGAAIALRNSYGLAYYFDVSPLPLVFLAILPPIGWWLITVRLLQRATHSWLRATVAAIFVPILCVTAVIVIFAACHFLVTFGILFRSALR